MKKRDFIKQNASSKVKNLSLISWIVLLLCILTFGYAVYNAHYGDMRQIPAFKIVLGDNIESLDKELETAFENDPFLESHQERAAKKLIQTFSFSNLITFAEVTDDTELDALSDIVQLFYTIVTVAAIISVLFTLLATLFKNNILLIFSLILSVATSMITAISVLIITILLHIILFIAFIIINKAYKSFKKNISA